MNSENRDLSPFKNVFEQPISRQIWRDKY
ncbi:MAG: hypothetical protein ACI9TA_001819, partial [Reinekea sp.]